MKKCELLIPAGGVDQYIAAVENGADAVYLGGKLYNARINAGNFSDSDLEAAVDFGHLRGVKTYVTMNTLVRDDELAAALEYAGFLYRIGVDALIIQDLGLGGVIKSALPDFPLHLSTQGSVYDRRGAEAAYELGYERVVPARELSLTEIEEAACGPAEIEVFVHGALCMCYSGQCQLSRFMGGRSGNMGSCAQPCRLPYKYIDSKGKLIEEGYPLSPKDLCLVEELGHLAEAGVASLKVEGRMKSPEYVAIVTRIYRKYLDLYYANGSYTVSKEDMWELTQIFNRGGFTSGYFYGNPGRSLMCSDLPKHQGIKVGSVVKKLHAGRFTKQQGGHLVDIRTDGPGCEVVLGDGVEIHAKALTGNVVTYVENLKGGITRIGDIKGNAEAGDLVYRITSKSLVDKARSTFAHVSFSEGKYLRKLGLTSVVRCGVGMDTSLEILSPFKLVVSEEAAGGQKPVNRETTPEDIIKQISKTGGTPFEFSEIKVEATEEGRPVYIPVSGLNALRRRALEELTDKLPKTYKRELPPDFNPDWKASGAFEIKAKKPKAHVYRYGNLADLDPERGLSEVLVPIRDFFIHREEIRAFEEVSGVDVSPFILNIGKGGGDKWIEENLDGLANLLTSESKPLYVGNLSWVKAFAERGVKVIGDYGLNIYNGAAAEVYKSLGVWDFCGSLEAVDFSDMGSEAVGTIPLMITEHAMEDGVLIGPKGRRFKVRALIEEHKTLIESGRQQRE